MTGLFNRDFSITVGETKINMRAPGDAQRYKHTLSVNFDVTKDGSSVPNVANVTIMNLSKDHRKVIEKDLPVIIRAGYVGDLQLIFEGDITKAQSEKQPTSWATKITAKDGNKGYTQARLNKSYAANIKRSQIILDAATELGIGLGNAKEKLSAKDRLLKRGATVTGSAARILDRYVKSYGLRWSIQDRQLMLLAPNETTLETVYILNRGSGLVGTPEIGEKGRVNFVSLLRGAIKPGRRVMIESEALEGGSGIYKVDKAVYDGELRGNSWYTKGEGIPVQ